jgi:hypothetical protein
VIATGDRTDFERLSRVRSDTADLVIAGLTHPGVRQRGTDGFRGLPASRIALFVSSDGASDIGA